MKSFLWRHKFLTAVWLVVFGISGYAGYLLFLKSSGTENPYVLSNSTSQESAENEPAEEKPSEPVKAAAGETVTDGSLEFTVFGIKCGEGSIGSTAYSTDVAEGEFCRVSLQVKNTGGIEASLPTTMQKVVSSDGKQYELDMEATQFTQADLSNGDWHAQIPSHTTRTGDLAFDVPAGTKVTKVLLFGVKESAGIEVSL